MRGVEPVHVLKKRAAAGADFPRRVRIGVVELVDVPPVRRHFARCIRARTQQLPKRRSIPRAAGQPAGDTDDRDRFVAGAFGGLELCRRLVERTQEPELV
jgi:hypothetical protein